MKMLLLGALFGLLIAYPTLLGLVLAVVAAVLSKPVLAAFGLGVAAQPVLSRRVRRWAS